MEVLGAFLTVLMRALGLIAVMPFFNSSEMAAWKLLLAAGLAFVSMDSVVLVSATESTYFLYLPGEFVLGFICGLPMAMVVNCVGIFGELFDSARGQSIGAAYDPLTNVQQAQMGMFGRNFVSLCILFLGGFEILLKNFFESLSRFPLGSLPALHFSQIGERLFVEMAAMLSTTFSLFLPLAAMLLSVELAAAFFIKILGQVSLSNELFCVKSFLGMLFILAMWKCDVSASLLRAISLSFF